MRTRDGTAGRREALPGILVAWLAAALILFPCMAVAAYTPFRTFSRAEGLPGTTVNCLFQDRDGLIWAGTDRGAARFDGRLWQAFTVGDGLAGPEVHSITQDSEGSIWFGTSGGVCRYNGLYWDRLGFPEGQAVSRRVVAVRDREDRLWFGAGILYLLDQAAGTLKPVTEVPLAGITSLSLDRDGVLWVTSAGGAARLDGARWRTFSVSREAKTIPVRGVLRDSRGTVWLAADDGLMEFDGANASPVKGDLPAGAVLSLAEDGGGRLWVGTAGGPAVFDGWQWQRPDGVDRWPDRRVNAMLADRGGNLWLGTDAGIVSLNLSWTTVSSESPGGPPRPPFLFSSAGSLWYALETGAEARSGRQADRFANREGLEGTLRGLIEDREGNLWFGTDTGLYRYDGRRFTAHKAPEIQHETVEAREGVWVDRASRQPDMRNGLTGESVNALLQDGRGWIWAATGEGLSALDKDRWRLFDDIPDLKTAVLSLAGTDEVWAGTDHGLMVYADGSWRDAAADGGPRKTRVNALLEEGRGHLWAGTDAGLWELREGRWRRYRQEDGLLSDRVTCLSREATGHLWVGTGAGLGLFDGDNWSSVTQKEGLPVQEVLSLGFEPSGKLMVGGPGYLAAYRPDRSPPQTYLKNAPAAPVGSPQYLFEYSGADLISEPYELRYSWRLDGGAWSPFSREALVTLTDLTNGSHTFEVRALDRGLNVDPTPAVAVFEVNTALFDVEVRSLTVHDLFASLYRYYASDFTPDDSPMGRLVLHNKYDRPLKVKVSLSIPRFMDFPTDRIVAVKAGEDVTLPLRLELNDSVLDLRENTVEQFMVTLQYYLQGKMKENRFSRPVTLNGRNAMVWDDPKRIALYISHLDPDIESLAAGAVAAGKKMEEEFSLDNNFIRGVVLFDLIGQMGIRFLPDPEHPYTGLSTLGKTLDFVRYPRETLALKSGDCDDIAVFYAALLQAVGIDTALVDVLDHIFLMFDTGLKGKQFRYITPDRARVFLDPEERVWIPVEVTLAGRPFTEAWTKGLAEMDRSPRNIINVKEAWKIYQPVLGTTDDRVKAPPLDREALSQAVFADLCVAEDSLLGTPFSVLRLQAAREPGNIEVLNRMGISLGKKGYYRLAQRCFEQVIRLAPGYAGGWANMANVLYEHGDYPKSVEYYLKALELDPENGQIHVEIALTYAEMGNFERARHHYLTAVRVKPELGATRPP